MKVRKASVSDAEGILAVYAPYVTDTAISFETEVPAIDEFAERIGSIIKSYPYFVCEDDNKIIGYAYASKFRERAAYKNSAELSIYIHPDYHREGVGTKLFNEMLTAFKDYDIYTLYSGITLPNEASVGFHKSFGFHEVGVFRNVGYKLSEWHDVIYLEKQIKDYGEKQE